LYPADPWKGSSHAMPFPVARGGAVVTWVTSTDAAAAVVFTPGERIPGYGARWPRVWHEPGILDVVDLPKLLSIH
jgi:hypothetical protein